MIEIDVDELKKQVDHSEIQFVGGVRDGDKVVPILTTIEHLASVRSMWWIEKTAIHLYMLNKNKDTYYMMYAGKSVDKLLELASEVYGNIPWNLAKAVPFLRSVEKGCKHYEGS